RRDPAGTHSDQSSLQKRARGRQRYRRFVWRRRTSRGGWRTGDRHALRDPASRPQCRSPRAQLDSLNLIVHAFDPIDGAVLLDKPAGPTSHDLVDVIRSQFRIKKVGHCGTLDPNASGLLVLLLGRATKLSEKLMSDDKVYTGWMKLGETTNS